MAAVITVAAAIVAATAAYFFRRREHLRERRLDAYQAVLAAFLDAARSAAALLSVHTQVGWPHELNREQWTEEQRSAMAQAHADAWERAATDRHAFEAAAYGVELVASASVDELVVLLVEGTPIDLLWHVNTAGADRRSPMATKLRRFLDTPDAMQAMHRADRSVPVSRFRPPVYVTLWS